jgi:hypothetical protein
LNKLKEENSGRAAACGNQMFNIYYNIQIKSAKISLNGEEEM